MKDGKKERTLLRLRTSTKRLLEKIANRDGRTLSAEVEFLIEKERTGVENEN